MLGGKLKQEETWSQSMIIIIIHVVCVAWSRTFNEHLIRLLHNARLFLLHIFLAQRKYSLIETNDHTYSYNTLPDRILVLPESCNWKCFQTIQTIPWWWHLAPQSKEPGSASARNSNPNATKFERSTVMHPNMYTSKIGQTAAVRRSG